MSMQGVAAAVVVVAAVVVIVAAAAAVAVVAMRWCLFNQLLAVHMLLLHWYLLVQA